MSGLFQAARRLFGSSSPIGDASSLSAFMDSRAAFLSQKCIVEFCRVRAGVYWQKLFKEEEFQQALTRSTWQGYPVAFAMVTEMVEASLRQPAGLRQRRLPDALLGVAGSAFAKYPVPAGLGEDFWEQAERLVNERLQQTQSGPPRPVREMPEPLARLIFETLPLHQRIVTDDYDYIRNNLRMNLLRAHEDFVAAARPGALVDDLLGAV